MAGQRSYLGVPPEERREQRRSALKEAALDCVIDDSVELSVRSVCAKARLTPRYFYESFANLDELLLVLFDELGADVFSAGMAAVDAAADDLHSRCRAAFEGAYSVVAADPRRQRLFTLTAGGNPVLQERRRQQTLVFAAGLLDYIATALGDQVAATSSAQAAALYMVSGATEVVTSFAAGSLDLTEDELGDVVADLLSASIKGLISGARG